MDNQTKQCSVCLLDFPATTEFFYKHRKSVHSKCKKCYNKYQAEKHSSPEYKFVRKGRLDSQREHINARQRAYYIANRERLLAWHSEWSKSRPDIWFRHNQKRRALLLGAEGSFTYEEWIELRDSIGRCLACGATDLPLTQDHIVPLSKGGTNYISNIQPLCGSCNSSKLAKTIDYRATDTCELPQR